MLGRIGIPIAKTLQTLQRSLSTTSGSYVSATPLFVNNNSFTEFNVDENSVIYHNEWLRDNCKCSKCLHAVTKEKIICSSEFNESHLTPETVNVDEENMNIKWEDGHYSSYNFYWLGEYSIASTKKAFLNPITSVKPTNSCVEWISMYNEETGESNDILPPFLTMVDVMNKVDTNGYCVIKKFGKDNGKLIETLNTVGYPLFESHFGIYENLEPAEFNKFNKHTDQLGYTRSRVDLHTDQPFLDDVPPYQSLHCISKAEVGGENMIADAKKVFDKLKQDYPTDAYLLSTVNVLFDRRQKHFQKQYRGPIVETDDNGNFVSVRSSYFTRAPLDIPFYIIKPYYEAYNRFHKMMRDPDGQVMISLEPGDIIIYNNKRMLHARTEFQGYRLMKGTYHTRNEEIITKMGKEAKELNDAFDELMCSYR